MVRWGQEGSGLWWVGGGHVPEASAMSRRQRCEAGSEAMQEQRLEVGAPLDLSGWGRLVSQTRGGGLGRGGGRWCGRVRPWQVRDGSSGGAGLGLTSGRMPAAFRKRAQEDSQRRGRGKGSRKGRGGAITRRLGGARASDTPRPWKTALSPNTCRPDARAPGGNNACPLIGPQDAAPGSTPASRARGAPLAAGPRPPPRALGARPAAHLRKQSAARSAPQE